MIRYITEQVKCKNCGFIDIKNFLLYYDAEKYPEHTERILKYDYSFKCMICGWKKSYDREIEVITPEGNFFVKTGWPKDKIKELFVKHNLITENNEE